MNSYRSSFEDQHVRKVLTMDFDFEPMNHDVFFSTYTSTDSYFEGSEESIELAYSGILCGNELQLIAPFRD